MANYRKTATHFIAFQVDDPEIYGNLEYVMKQFCKELPELESSEVVVSRSHLSLLTFHVESEDRSKLDKAKEVFETVAQKFASRFSNAHLTFKGIKDMCIGRERNHRVVYADTHTEGFGDLINDFISELREAYEEADIVITTRFKQPLLHLSIFNTMIGDNPMSIPNELLDKFKDFRVGSQRINGVQLLSRKKQDGYYERISEVQFTG